MRSGERTAGDRRHARGALRGRGGNGDTPASVREFLGRYGAENAVHYLIGSEAELRPLWDAFFVVSSLDTGRDDLHSAPVRVFTRDGFWFSTLRPGQDLTADNLAHDTRLALER